jgi:hypothetical protein
MKGYQYQSDFAKKYVAQGHAEGLTKGFIEGFIKGFIEGLTKGRTEATALNLLTVLRVRGIAVQTPSASVSWPRRIRNGWNAGWRRPPLPLQSLRSSTNRTEALAAGGNAYPDLDLSGELPDAS